MTHLRIGTASRLHFGLLGWGPHVPRQFGGVGLMVADPGIELTAAPAARWSVTGPLADRVEAVIAQIRRQWHESKAAGGDMVPARIEVITAPSHHVGLGVGTQLALAVARLVLHLSGHLEPTVQELAVLTGRGRRSGIGLHGFAQGGLIVDGGRRDDAHPPPLIARMPFPDDWSILIVQPPGPQGRHGPDEVQAFQALAPLTERVSERLCRLVLLGILPAVAEHNLEDFGAAVAELQAHTGAAFAPVQGGLYASPQAETIIALLNQLGLTGAGQSSWGPTLYAFSALPPRDLDAVAQLLVDRSGLPATSLLWTTAFNHGSVLNHDS